MQSFSPLSSCPNQGTASCQSRRCACVGAGVLVGCWCEKSTRAMDCAAISASFCLLIILSCIGVISQVPQADCKAKRAKTAEVRQERFTERSIQFTITMASGSKLGKKQKECSRRFFGHLFQITIQQGFALVWPCALAQAGNHRLRAAWCLLAFQKCSLCCSGCGQVSQTCDATQSFSGLHSD